MTTSTAKALNKIANEHSPTGIVVPNTIWGLVTWAVGRFGGGAVIGFMAAYAAITIYTDAKLDRQQSEYYTRDLNKALLTSYSEQVKATYAQAKALEDLVRAIDELKEEQTRKHDEK